MDTERVDLSGTTSRTYQVGASTLSVIQGDLTHSACEVLVSSDDVNLSMGGGVSQALLMAAGREFLHYETRKRPRSKLGDIVVTSAGLLPARYIFHAVTIDWDSQHVPADLLARTITLRVLDLLPRLGCTSVAFPAIGTGVAGLGYADVVGEMAESIIDFLLETPEEYRVELYAFDRFGQNRDSEFFSTFENAIGANMALSWGGDNLQIDLPHADRSGVAMSVAAQSEVMRDFRRRRAALELEIVQCANDPDAEADQRVRLDRELNELHRLAAAVTQTTELPANRGAAVFLSSTQRDLRLHREAAAGALHELNRQVERMEGFHPERGHPADVITRKVRSCGNYLGIIGFRYGSVDPASGKSFTEIEYDAAHTSGREMRIFVLGEDGVQGAMFETDSTKLARQMAFRDRVGKDHTVVMFDTVEELRERVMRVFGSGR